MSYFIGICRHCGGTLGMSLFLCDTCAKKALDILPSDPKERIEIYKIVIDQTNNPVVKWSVQLLMDDAIAEVEQQLFGTVDIFDERG